jgi:hypothetical protein
MTAVTISFRADEQTMAELRQLAGGGNLSNAIRELIHAQYAARLYAQAARDAERLRNHPADLAEIKAVNEELIRGPGFSEAGRAPAAPVARRPS